MLKERSGIPLKDERHEQIIRLHLKPALGRVKLSKLTPSHVQGLYRDKLDSGLSPATIQKVHTVLHKALAQALKWNMMARATPPMRSRLRGPPPKGCARFSPDEARKLIEAVRGDKLETLYVLAVHTGMRQGELLALKWEDIALNEGVIRNKTHARPQRRTNRPRRAEDKAEPSPRSP